MKKETDFQKLNNSEQQAILKQVEQFATEDNNFFSTLCFLLRDYRQKHSCKIAKTIRSLVPAD